MVPNQANRAIGIKHASSVMLGKKCLARFKTKFNVHALLFEDLHFISQQNRQNNKTLLHLNICRLKIKQCRMMYYKWHIIPEESLYATHVSKQVSIDSLAGNFESFISFWTFLFELFDLVSSLKHFMKISTISIWECQHCTNYSAAGEFNDYNIRVCKGREQIIYNIWLCNFLITRIPLR